MVPHGLIILACASLCSVECSARAIHSSLGALDENMRLMEKCRETQTELNDLKHEMKKALKEREELKEENLMLVSQNAALVEFQEVNNYYEVVGSSSLMSRGFQQLTGEKNFLELLLNKVRLEKAAVEGRLDELKCSCKSVEALDAKVKSLLIDGENLMSQVKERDAQVSPFLNFQGKSDWKRPLDEFQIDLLTVELGSLRPELAKYKAEAAELQASRTRIDQQWQERLKMEESENTKLRAQVDSLKSILASDTTVEVIKAKEAEIAQLTEQLERAQTQVAAVKDVQDAFKQQRAALEEAQHEVKRKNGEVSQLEKLLDEHLREREELSGQLQTAIADHNEVVVELREEIAALTKKSPATFKTISNSTQTGVVQSDRRLQEIRAYLDEISQFLLRFEDRQADRTDEDETDERQVLLDGLHKILSRQLKVIEDTLLEDSTLNYIDKEKFARVLAELGEKYDKSIDDLRDGHNEFWSRQMQTARTHSAGLRQLYQAAQATINTQREALTEERQANQQLRQDYTVLLKETEKAKFDAADWRQLAEVARTEVELITTKCSKVEQRLQRQEADLIRYRDGVELRNQDIRKLLIKKIQRRYELQRLERQNKELRYHKNYINSVLGEYQDAERRQEELLDQMGFPRVESKCVIKRKSFKVIATLIRASLKFRSGGQYYRRKLTEMEKVIAQLSSGLNQQVTSDDSKQNASHNVSDIINDTQQSNRSFGADKSAALQPTLTSGSLRPSLLGGVKSQANKSDDFEEMVPIKLASNTH